MASLNQVQLIGHLGNDPETRYTPSGDAVVNFSLATSESWKDKDSGERKERTEWHRIVIWRKLAEIAAQYLQKGSQVFLQGKLQTRKWQDKEGIDRYTVEVVVDNMVMLGSPRGKAADDGGFSDSDGQRQHQQDKASGYALEGGRQQRQAKPKPNFDDMDDDIPF